MSEPEVQPAAQESAISQLVTKDFVNQTENPYANEDEVLDRLFAAEEPESTRAVPIIESSAPDPDFNRALKALQRDGVPASVIDGLKSDPSKVKEWGLKAAKRQADVDAFGAKVSDSKKDAPKAAETPRSSISTGDEEADADPLSSFGEIFGDDAAKPIRNLASQLRAEFAESARVMTVKHESEMAYTRISHEFGKHAPPFDEMTELAARIGREQPQGFNSVEEIYREAFRQRLGEPKKSDLRNVARPTVGNNPPRPVRQIDRDDAVLDILLSGGSRADALRIVSR